MKSLKFITVLLLFSTLFISCNDTDTEEELQLSINNQETVAGDSGDDPVIPPLPPPPN